MADAVEAVKEAPAQAGRSLGHKLGPLPLWAWIAGGVLGAAALYYVFIGKAGASGAPSFPNMPGVFGNGGGSGGGGSGPGATGGDGTGATGVAEPTTASAAEIQTALNSVATSLRLPFSQVKMYWDEYINGQTPVGNSQAVGSFNNVVNSILTGLGSKAPAPQAAQGVNANPYTNNSSWLNAILGYTGSDAGVINELVQLVAGTRTEISQATADALTAAERIVGGAPTALGYTIKIPTVVPPVVPPNPNPNPPLPPPSPAAPSFDLAKLGAWATSFLNRWAATFTGDFVASSTGAAFVTHPTNHSAVAIPLTSVFSDWASGLRGVLPSGVTLSNAALVHFWNDFQGSGGAFNSPSEQAQYILHNYQQYNTLNMPGQISVKTSRGLYVVPATYAFEGGVTGR